MEKNQLTEYIEKGLSVKEIANELEVGMNSVKYWLKFYQLNTNAQEIKYECPSCKKSPSIVHFPFCSKVCSCVEYSSNPNNYLAQKERAWVRKLRLVNEKGGCCQRCGYRKNLSALEFHHIDPQNKSFNLDARKIGNSKWELILAEAAKCELICSNCHAEEHSIDSEIEKIEALSERLSKGLDEKMRKKQTLRKKETRTRKTLGIPQKRKGNWPTIENMEKLIWEKPSIEIAKEIGVSDSAVVKFCKKWGITKPSRGYWQKLKHDKETSAHEISHAFPLVRMPKYEREKLFRRESNP
jgi:transposase